MFFRAYGLAAMELGGAVGERRPMASKTDMGTADIDGRRARSRSSRRRIVAAMVELIEGGDLMPSAARVAEEAGVGLRTVFRHFDDMDTPYAELSATLAARVMPVATAPYDGADWRAGVTELPGPAATASEPPTTSHPTT